MIPLGRGKWLGLYRYKRIKPEAKLAYPETMKKKIWEWDYAKRKKILLTYEERKRGNKMQLSIVTVCYNEKDIGRTCESIVSQSCQDFEWIVVDGGSTDGSLEVIKHYKERIDILIRNRTTAYMTR